jgi:hypothetical protein
MVGYDTELDISPQTHVNMWYLFKTKEVNINKPVQNTVSGDVEFENLSVNTVTRTAG